MKTIGQVLKEARLGKRYSLVKMENITRIKKDFIEALENEDWEALPAFPTILGFAKSLASPLDIPENSVVAVLKRDYPPKKLFINPKPDISSKFIWSPKLTFFVGAGMVLSIIFGYLIFQYIRFSSPPKVVVEVPIEGEVVNGKTVHIVGNTETDAKILINNQPVLVSDNGKFTIDLAVTKDTKEIVVKSISRSGKSTEIKRKIEVQ
ncbi:MAG: helix-turn-helix domain-containing protein [Patescibacteria group bacterium]